MQITGELCSIGFLSQMFQRSPRRLQRELQEGGFQPAVLINGVPHYGQDAVEALEQRQNVKRDGAEVAS